MVKRYGLYLIALFLSAANAFAAVDTDKWQVSKSTHFIVYYKNAPVKFIDMLIKEAEGYYDKIAENLGFRRYDFWLWDNRAKIYIYDDAKDYRASAKQPAWSAGCAIIKEKKIYTYPYAQGFFQTILPHEMGHIIFREFVGFDNPAVPLWLDEGVACYQEASRYNSAKVIIKQAMNNANLIGMGSLFNFNPGEASDSASIDLFYAEAVSVIDYLIKNFGKDNFVLFCQGLRDKRDIEKAIRYAYHFNNVQEMNMAWLEYLDKY